MELDLVDTIWWVLIGYTTFIRMKYVWQGNKVRRTKSTRDVSTKAILNTHIEYWIMFAHNLNVADIKDQFFWGFGIFTTAYTVYCLWKYREDKNMKFFRWVSLGITGKLKDEGGWLW